MKEAMLTPLLQRSHTLLLAGRRIVARPQWWSVVGLLLVLLAPPVIDPADEEKMRAIGHWLDLPANLAPADALVVMGGDWRRIAPGVELFQQGYAPEFWYTGSEIPAANGLYQAERMGVPAGATAHILGVNTWEETAAIARAIDERNLHSVLVVTSWYHGRRTLCALNHHLAQLPDQPDPAVQVYYQPVDYERYGPDNWWLNERGRKLVLAEVAKFGFYWLNYGLPLQSC